ncbi:hypothetical protein DAPPUDRAFT_313440 [Daphnia pulex]|uniref:THAP-type domain-containing protein n=1 Tax=Daphnia pulex TaxID=6669 RepID=E9G494_DAPPU|nr:hypothetical protein DAPPUDRAFT_313440 [Daphnia pulex]|eukprot:EFX85714.1 hypothetical protein DAPPUDRAFT_313440 [Daphnia pulex]
MGRTCDIIGCTNSNYKTEKLSYHSLPSNELLRGKWLDAISANGGFRQSKTRKKAHNCDNTYICGEHFSEDCYIPTSKQKHLKPTAVPTFPPTKKDDAIEGYVHKSESPFQGTPETSGDESPPKTKRASKSKKKKAAEKSRKKKSPVLSDIVITNIIDQYRETVTHGEEEFTIRCTSSQNSSVADGEESVGTFKQLERDIENDFRTLEMLDSYLQRIFKDKQELELGESLAHLTVQKEETQQQLIHRREEKLTKEMAWTEEQKSVYELQQNLLSDDKNTEHLREMEKILSEREEEIKQLRNLTNDEIFVLEEKVKDLDRRISEFQDNRSTKLEELLNQESTLQIKKKDLIEDLKQKVEESKVLEIKLIQNKAGERFNKLDRYTS